MNTDINDILDKAENKCKASGVKLTRKRKLILESLLESKELLSAYDIVDCLKHNKNEDMPPMSVYRILEFLEASKLVHKLESQNKYVACRHIQCNHKHQSAQFLICQNCTFVDEINLNADVMGNMIEIAANQGFKLEHSVMEFKGICAQCQTNAN